MFIFENKRERVFFFLKLTFKMYEKYKTRNAKGKNYISLSLDWIYLVRFL